MEDKDIDKILTISIPTYNRKNQLTRLLHSIQRQNCIELYKIKILDNCSDYSIEEALSQEFSPDFNSNIEVIKRNINGGADYNITSTFCYMETKLMWLLGDDDETRPNSIRTIIEKYYQHPDISVYKYSMNALHPQSEDIDLNNVADLTKCLRDGIIYSGDLIFMSNNVYNVSKVKKYFPDCLYYSYCSAGHTIPLLRTLMSQDEKALLCKELIVKYNTPEGDHWNFLKVVTSLGSFLDIQSDNYKDVRAFFKIMCAHFGIGEFLLNLLSIKDKPYRNYLYKKAMNSVFSAGIGPIGYCTCMLYHIENATGVKLLSKGYRKLYKVQNDFKFFLKEKAKTDKKIFRCVALMKRYFPKLK